MRYLDSVIFVLASFLLVCSSRSETHQAIKLSDMTFSNIADSHSPHKARQIGWRRTEGPRRRSPQSTISSSLHPRHIVVLVGGQSSGFGDGKFDLGKLLGGMSDIFGKISSTLKDASTKAAASGNGTSTTPPAPSANVTAPPDANANATSLPDASANATSLPDASANVTSPPDVSANSTVAPAAGANETSTPAPDSKDAPPPAGSANYTSISAPDSKEAAPAAGSANNTSTPPVDSQDTAPPPISPNSTDPPAASANATTPPDTSSNATPQRQFFAEGHLSHPRSEAPGHSLNRAMTRTSAARISLPRPDRDAGHASQGSRGASLTLSPAGETFATLPDFISPLIHNLADLIPTCMEPVEIVETYFERVLSENRYQYKCRLCQGKWMKSTAQHKNLANHKARVLAKEKLETRESEKNKPLGSFLAVGTNDHDDSDESDVGNLQEQIFAEEADSPNLRPDPVGYSEALMRLLTSVSESEESDTSDIENAPTDPVDGDWESLLREYNDQWDTSSDEQSTSAQSNTQHNDDEQSEPDNAPDFKGSDPDWYPFRKEQMIALLLLGSGRNLLSQRQYERMCLLNRKFNVVLPAYKTLGRLRSSMCRRLGLNVVEWESALANPCYGLSIREIVAQELANPVVAEHLVFAPEYEPEMPTTRFSQSKKWREGFPRTHRVQMVVSKQAGHVYLYEPLRDMTRQWIVPIYFFQTSGIYYAKCVRARMVSDGIEPSNVKFIVESEQQFDCPDLITVQVDTLSSNFVDTKDDEGNLIQSRCGNAMYQHKAHAYTEIPLPNVWRIKAKGKVIRNVPITLYSDDTSGNVSKRWNKHMSYYFTLSALPPGMTNQVFNIHFLATSNKSSALELGDHIVDELNALGKDGFTTHDLSLGTDVLVMVLPLCHLGDSPMHAEITNTTNPSITLNPCRICTLSVDTLIAKQDAQYTRAFVGLDKSDDGVKLRDWLKTKTHTYELWNLLRNPKKHSEFRQKSKDYGIRDTVCVQFVERFQELHQNPDYSREEVAQMFDDLNKEFGDRLFNPFLRLDGFDGHLDTPVEILHVVLLGVVKYLFRDAMDNLSDAALPSVMARWKSFDPKGLNIPPIQPKTMTHHYQSLVGKDFRTVLQTVPFVLFPHFSQARRHLIYWTAQWTNKPKFHMLIHLVESIDRFGPLLLCATETFESFNGILRWASVRSNRHNPGLQIATTFMYSRLLRLLFSGASFWDYKKNCRATAGKEVVKLFSNNPWIQKDLGYNSKWKTKGNIVMKEISEDPRSPAPQILKDNFPEHVWSPGKELYLASRQRIPLNTFVLVDLPSDTGPRLAFVQSLWKGRYEDRTKMLSELKICKLSPVIDEFYGFRGTSITTEVLWVPVESIRCVINVQHNCHLAKCQMQTSPARHDGQLPIKAPYQIKHNDMNAYIINSGALYSAEDHRELVNITYDSWSREQWEESIRIGLKNWESARHKKAASKVEKQEKEHGKNEFHKSKKRQREDLDPRLQP
ncbi:hypothetical protein DFH28DRAFT_1218091 [Melampsora americana]|nr:hypothetical protein DFH28DRAFT_1218091 [Melampsora americana]